MYARVSTVGIGILALTNYNTFRIFYLLLTLYAPQIITICEILRCCTFTTTQMAPKLTQADGVPSSAYMERVFVVLRVKVAPERMS